MNSLSNSESSAPVRGRVVRRLWRAPREDRGAIVVPGWNNAPAVVASNQDRFQQLSGELMGLSWPKWRAWCREACLAAARDYTSNTLGQSLPEDSAGALIVDGHQPELFHPGVWAKNFAVGRLAERVQGTSLHLIVDNDASALSTIHVPAGSREQPRLQSVPFDAPRPLQPWESRIVSDAQLFTTFAEETALALRPWGIDPVVQEAWPAAVQQLRQKNSLVDALTSARVFMERKWGLRNLELPLSRLCTLPPCLWLVATIVARLPEFVSHYNAVLREYRCLNRVRSRSHPVPDLAHQDEWYEAPFWVWQAGDTQRDRLWVRRRGSIWTLRDSREELLHLEIGAGGDASTAIERLSDLERRGVHLRTRALTTTLFARLGLADLFVHGLGGAKYDEMTDALMGRFFDVDPPSFMTVSATAHLPLGTSWNVSVEDRGRLRHAIRDLEYNPDRQPEIREITAQAPLIAEKRQLVDQLDRASVEFQQMSRVERRRRYLRLREVNTHLAATLSGERGRLEMEAAHVEQLLEANRILRRREFSWVTFPAEKLQGLYAELFQ